MIRVLGIVLVATLIAIILAGINVYRSDRAGDKSREALCQVLLFVRDRSLHPRVGPPPTNAQAVYLRGFYGELVALVEGCEIPESQA